MEIKRTIIVRKQWISQKGHDRLNSAHQDEGHFKAADLKEGAANDWPSQLCNVHHRSCKALREQKKLKSKQGRPV